jgi:tripartite motif-containing protein 68
LQWKLQQALEHLRKEQEEAWKLEVSEKEQAAIWKAGCT